MDPDRLTQKSQEALHDAQTKAMRFGHTEVDVEHLLLALLDQRDGIVVRLLARLDADLDGIRRDTVIWPCPGRAGPDTRGRRSSRCSSSRRSASRSTPARESSRGASPSGWSSSASRRWSRSISVCP